MKKYSIDLPVQDYKRFEIKDNKGNFLGTFHVSPDEIYFATYDFTIEALDNTPKEAVELLVK